MKRALIVIDYTCDFVASDGALTCGVPAQEVEGYIAEVTEEFLAKGDPVVLAVDLHEKDDPFHPETALFPPHNIRGTHGRDLYGLMGKMQGAQSHLIKWMDKTRYNAFAGTDLDMWLRARNIKEIHLVGVCTDICVLYTAAAAYDLGVCTDICVLYTAAAAYDLGYKIVVHERGVASFNQPGHMEALRKFKEELHAEVLK